MYIASACGRPEVACPNGPVTVVLMPLASGNPGLPPFLPGDPGYVVQPCDTITWDFGDGTGESFSGSDRVTHNYPSPGNYTIRATVSNALGTNIVSLDGAVIATSPSKLNFPIGTGGAACGASDCTVVREGSGSATIPVRRTLDLSRAISADVFVTDHDKPVTATYHLSFAPNETIKTFTVPIPDDQIYTEDRHWFRLSLGNLTGGTLVWDYGSETPWLVVLEDEPLPTMSIAATFSVKEGDSGMTLVAVPVYLTAPMGYGSYANAFFDRGSVAPRDFDAGYGPNFRPGETISSATAWIRANTLPEPDKTFQVRIASTNSNISASMGVTTSTVTILNDDAALYPAQTTVTSGTPVNLTLDIGSPYSVPTVASFSSSAPNVVAQPAAVTIPAGATKVEITVTPQATGRTEISAVLPARTTQPAVITATAVRRRATTH